MNFSAFPRTRLTPLATLVSLSLLALSGCATKEFVQQEVGGVNGRIDTLQTMLNTLSQRTDGNSVRLNHSDVRLGQAEQTATTLGSRIDDNLAGLVAANHRLDGLSADLVVAGRNITANSAEIARAHQRVDATEVQVQASRRRLEGTVAGLVLAENRLVVAESTLKTLSQAAPSVVESRIAATMPRPEAKSADVAPVPVAAPVATLGDANSRLDSIAVLVATANQRIAANSSAIDNVASRLGSVEGGLSETRKRTEAGEQALLAANVRIDETRGETGAVKQHVAAQGEAIVAVEKRVAGMVGAMTTTNTQIDGADKHLADAGERLAQVQASIKSQGDRIGQNEKGLGETGAQLGQVVAAIAAHEQRMLRDETATVAVSATAREALERAITAGRLAEGKLLYETILSEELSNFDLEQAKLSGPSKQALTAFAEKLRAENKNVFIEIQGHTDNTGSTARNQRLARERAEVVRAFLHDSGGIPLHRMAVAAYGESRPLADNRTRDGRMKNRRVVLVVLR